MEDKLLLKDLIIKKVFLQIWIFKSNYKINNIKEIKLKLIKIMNNNTNK